MNETQALIPKDPISTQMAEAAIQPVETEEKSDLVPATDEVIETIVQTDEDINP